MNFRLQEPCYLLILDSRAWTMTMNQWETFPWKGTSYFEGWIFGNPAEDCFRDQNNVLRMNYSLLLSRGIPACLSCEPYIFTLDHLDKHMPTCRWDLLEWESNLTSLQLCQQDKKRREKGGRGKRRDKRRVFVLARPFLQCLVFCLTYVDVSGLHV